MKLASRNFLKLKYKISCFFIICLLNFCFSQIIYKQSIFKGGVTGDGFNPNNFNVNGDFNVYIEPNSIIRQAYLFVSVYGEPENRNLLFNGNNITLDFYNSINNNYTYQINSFIQNVKTIIIDVSDFINPAQQVYSISPPQNQNENLGIYREYYLYIEYENQNLDYINNLIILNKTNSQTTVEYDFSYLNPINLNRDVSFAIHTNHYCDTIQDGSYIFVNNNLIGLVGGHEAQNPGFCAGVTGSFYHQNNILNGLRNDTPDYYMKGTDAIANIKNHIFNNLLNIKFSYQSPSNVGNTSNPINQLFFAYSTPCAIFMVSNTPDTTICPNVPLQLFVSGGTSTGTTSAYEWLASTGSAANVLSCTDCPNPVFTGDKSTLLTVRIWNNDSCSVVRPIKVNVHPKPSLSTIATTNTDCGTANGKVVLTPATAIASYRLDNGAPQVGITFNDLSEGLHNLQLTDAFGCLADTFFTIKDTIRTIAKFYPSPGFGYLPLEVAFLNQSAFASTYDWKIGNTFVDELSSYTFDSAGVHNITLYAWQFDATCVDSFSLKISVYDNFSFVVPNIFTPNADTKNDVFGMTVSNEVEVSYEIFNRWGNLVARGTNTGKGFVALWDGTSTGSVTVKSSSNSAKGSEIVTDGTYFYKLSISLKEDLFLPEKKQSGILDQTDFPIKAEGFVQVSR